MSSRRACLQCYNQAVCYNIRASIWRKNRTLYELLHTLSKDLEFGLRISYYFRESQIKIQQIFQLLIMSLKKS